jgi:hypothetical protein
MKKFYMTMVAMLCGVAAMAQNELYADDFKVDAGSTTADLVVKMRNADDVTAISFRLGLPEGVSMALNKKGKKYVTIDEDRMDDHTYIIQDASDGSDMISVYSASKATFYENDGPVVTVPLTIPGDDATYQIRIYNVSISNPAAVSVATSTECTVTLTVGEGDGINGINAADSKAPIYNVAGQRVSKAQKGVYIQNGKKVAVK